MHAVSSALAISMMMGTIDSRRTRRTSWRPSISESMGSINARSTVPRRRTRGLQAAARLQDLEPVAPEVRRDHLPEAAIAFRYQNTTSGG